ncbi:hypothetical protein GRF61_14855 [Azoarcus sp. TTM-91]|uniref:hypothetical protein n=1 Tax=Azoarcus sp. TTM-91 TaxID=2691581 RepID=UPI00145C494B|nr:hypothetical protein [Azoarcus sp. TTM-91]NMG35726.1 hypothetical protein [Azoarcus sp. TTM-91]
MRQQAAEVEAGGSLTLAAGQDLTLVASAARAGDEAYLYAGRDLSRCWRPRTRTTSSVLNNS